MTAKHVSVTPPRPFSKLPKRKREFIEHYVKNGDVVSSFVAAGYKGPERQRTARARRLAKELAPYIDEALSRYITSTEVTVFGLSRLRHLATEADSEQVQFNAAKEILNRNLPEAPKEIKHTHSHENMSDVELIARIKQLQGDLALPIDAVATVVKDDE